MIDLSYCFKVLVAGTLVTAATLDAATALADDFPMGSFTSNGGSTTATFDGKGQFRVLDKGEMVVAGQYSVANGKVKVTDVDGPWACTKAGETSGTYRWKLKDAQLTFSKVGDRCKDRAQSLTTTKWQRQG